MLRKNVSLTTKMLTMFNDLLICVTMWVVSGLVG